MPPIYESFEDLPPTPAEEMEARNRLVSKENDRRERRRIFISNRAKGHDEPRPGNRMFVSLGDRTIEARRRAGVRFERGHRATVLIVDDSDETVAKAQEMGQFPEGVDGVVNVYGAEQILEDDALVVHQSAASPEDVQLLRRQKEDLEREVVRMREENAALRAARMSAPKSEHGEPSRLIAAKNAASKAGTETTAEFGKDPKDPK